MKKTSRKDEEREANLSLKDLENPKVVVNADGVEHQIVGLTNDLQRTRADFENFRKQVEIQKENEKNSVKLATVYKVLPLLDDLDRAINTYSELAPLQKSLEKTLNELKLAKIPADETVEFNPDLHEAVMAEGDGEKEVISEVLRPGYYYENAVLRPAMVKVKRV